jgi:hypothetical protein
MRYAYSLVPEDEPIIRDMAVYDGTGLAIGELLMLGTTDPDSNADQGISLITAYTNSSAEAVDAVGICLETPGDTDNVYATAAGGPNYAKVIINPFAVYRAEYLQDAANDLAVTSNSTTTLTITSLEDDIDGGWVFFPLNATGVKNSLRLLTASASGSATMDSALSVTAVGTDTIIKILPVNHRTTDLDTTATGLITRAAIGSGVSLHVLENHVRADGISTQPLRRLSHAGLNNVTGSAFFADLVMLDHMLNMGN